MGKRTNKIDGMPVVNKLKDFDRKSGNILERLIYNNRIVVIILCALITLLLGYQASRIGLSASFEKMIPHGQPYIQNYLQNKGELPGLGNTVRIVVENKDGDIMEPEYLEILRQVTDAVILTPGVDRAWVKSLWTPGVRWTSVTEEGFRGGPVMPADYNGSAESLSQLQTNIANAGIIGSMVSLNNKSSMIIVPMLDRDSTTGKPFDNSVLSGELEKIRNIGQKSGKCNIRIIGFAKLMGDLMDGLARVISFFVIAIIIIAVIIYLYSRCVRTSVMVILSSMIAVVWQLGILCLAGFDLNPFTILVPFLVFAIGVSHGLQVSNGIMHEIGRGTHKVVAARYTFRRLFLPGITALITDAIGFAVLMIIDVPVIRELAMTASIGVAVLILTNLVMLPVAMTFVGVRQTAANRSLNAEKDKDSIISRLSDFLVHCTERRWAVVIVLATMILGVVGSIVSLDLQIGDLDPGAPELRQNSRYNLDNEYITSNYALSSDVFAVIVKTPPMGGMQYETIVDIDRLAWEIEQLPAVQSTISLANSIKMMTAGTCEGSPKWYTLSRNQRTLNFGLTYTLQNNPEMSNLDVSIMPLVAYLKDHKAATLESVVHVVEEFAGENNSDNRQFLLAAGNAGIEAATNIIVKKSNRTMLLYVYASIISLCFIAFRNWRAVVVAVVPLILTSILCQMLMVFLGMGVKVATLSVTSLGVGIGVDYAIYLLSVQLMHQRSGLSLKESYSRAIHSTGKVVALIGFTLAAGVITWMFSPIKFQADMGILLTFMILWNMTGALVITPALSHFLLQTSVVAREHSIETGLNQYADEVIAA